MSFSKLDDVEDAMNGQTKSFLTQIVFSYCVSKTFPNFDCVKIKSRILLILVITLTCSSYVSFQLRDGLQGAFVELDDGFKEHVKQGHKIFEIKTHDNSTDKKNMLQSFLVILIS